MGSIVGKLTGSTAAAKRAAELVKPGTPHEDVGYIFEKEGK